jgi:hypothetical protein
LKVNETQPSAQDESTVGPALYEQCDHCAAPVERAQRYCVGCGTHRRHVHDPAARYLATITARTRATSTANRPPAAANRRSHGLGVAIAFVLIPLAVGVGVLVGRASTSGDAKLIAALRAQRPEIITTGASPAATPVASAPVKSKPSRRTRAAGGGKALSTTAFGTAHQVVGSKPTASQLATGARVVQHIQQTQGKSYVGSQRGLPDQISVP